MNVIFDISGERQKAPVVKNNSKTVLVRLPDGNVIKRHKVRHMVSMSYSE